MSIYAFFRELRQMKDSLMQRVNDALNRANRLKDKNIMNNN